MNMNFKENVTNNYKKWIEDVVKLSQGVNSNNPSKKEILTFGLLSRNVKRDYVSYGKPCNEVNWLVKP